MPDISVYIANLDALVRSFPERTQAILEKAALDAKALVDKRTESGVAPDGTPFSNYSKRWAKVRGKEKPKDFHHTGALFRGVGIVSKTPTQVSIAPKPEDEIKITRNEKYEGKAIFATSKEEADLITKYIEKEIAALLNGI